MTKPRRPKPAAAGRVVATGVSVSALLGVVAGLTVGDRTAPPAQATVTSTTQNGPDLVRVVVRVHHAAGTKQAPAPYVVPAPQPPTRTVYVHRAAPVTTTHASH